MSWLLRKLDSLLAAVLAAVAGLGLSQAQAFAQQYLQRLGGHRDEAERAWQSLQASIGDAADTTAQRLSSQAYARFQDLAGAYDAIREAAPLLKPLALARRLDSEIARRVVADYQPALPIETASLVYALAGMLLALLLYDLLKWPFAALFRPARRRRGASSVYLQERRRTPRGPD